MPMSYTEEGEQLADKSPCAELRASLKMCLLESDCCKKEKVLPRDCLKRNDSTVPEECHALKYTFFECKRSILDMRTRFRGRKGETYN
ncbi:cytochrome c oxidase assembly factor 5 [Sitodiplosis mosellana]|uniref:cytochrome c oxidase assembly factor 5 n=1 Tax=Sitodiplosis mosellana TaxID=263140 RepID=UPI002444F973|nr:cytochrome c oxidase assembly factor 5 [Sitodiplosis mosellana]